MIFHKFELQNLGEFHDLYLKTDCLLLACVMENFREMTLKYYGLECLWYFTIPGMAFDSALKMSKVKLEQITDPSIFTFFEKGIRGGTTIMPSRFERARNRYIDKSIHPSDPNQSYIFLIDKNNLYGQSMLAPLATGGLNFYQKKKRGTSDLTE